MLTILLIHLLRLDLWSSDISSQRMLQAIESLNLDPAMQETKSIGRKEMILQGTRLRDQLLKSFDQDLEFDEALAAQEERLTGQQTIPLLRDTEAGAFAGNQIIQSWATRYQESNPIVIDGDPVIGLNESQVKAMAMMIGKRLSLVQGVS